MKIMIDISSYRFESARLFQIKYFMGVKTALTGSLALVLHGFELNRECNDIDIIVEALPANIPADWKQIELPREFKMTVYETQTELLGYSFKVNVLLAKEFDIVQVHGINLATVQDIIDAKRDFGLTGTKKHLIDFHSMLTQLFTEKK